MSMIQTNNTHWLLEQWARWAHVNPDAALGYPNATPFRRLMGSVVSSPLINDAEALEVDLAVSMLHKRHPAMGEAVILYYFNNENMSKVARVMNVHRTRADVLIKSGTAWLDAALGMIEAA